jgi:predicted metal-dependent hydrolase
MMSSQMSTAALQQLPLLSDPAGSDWRVRRSGRARRLSVRVFRDGGVEIVVPARVGPQLVAAFVARHREWIERQQRRVPTIDCSFPPSQIVLGALGETWLCRVVPQGPLLREYGAGGNDPGGGGVLELCLTRGELAVRRALLGWLVAHAAAALQPALAALALRMGHSYRRLQVRTQRTRWGSCSTRGTISLNCCLLFHRPEVVRYLCVHELAHLAHMNHSARFWQHVARFEPQWRELDRELARGWGVVPGWLLSALRA